MKNTQVSAVDAPTPELSEPIAIVGLGCRLPGAANPTAFWELLQTRADPIKLIPRERWDGERFYSEDARAPGTTISKHGGFIEGIEYFDCHFFGISPKEAPWIEPQQRLMLEVAFEAFEDAGLSLQRLEGSSTGVFVGSMGNEYAWRHTSRFDSICAYTPTGSSLSILSNRLSYVFDLQGPSFTVDCACSSSLLSAALACRSLASGESDLALAGGVSIMLSPASTIGMSKAGALSPDGRCKSFDERANGYVRSEGAGAVVLKRWSDAVRDHDRVYAVIRGFGLNNDGRTNGLTAPNRGAQERVLRRAYKAAGIDPSTVQYVEAHGTGTPLGDPIEAAALGAVIGRARLARGQPPCLLGTAKATVGHLEGAAGIAGIIKTALMLQRRELLPTLHYTAPNPHIDFERLGLQMAREHEPWPAGEVARAGISAFGFGGTNCHLVLEEVQQREARPSSTSRAELLLLSARSEVALRALATAYADKLEGGAVDVRALCTTAALKRSAFDQRAFAVAAEPQQLAASLRALSAGDSTHELGHAHAARGKSPKVAFVFPGLGPQWEGMAAQLLREEPVFRAAIVEIDALCSELAPWSVLAELEGPQSGAAQRDSQIDLLQTTLFAIQVGLAALLRSWGIEPAAVVGHSMGEVASAHVAGALTLRDAVRVIVERSGLLHASSGDGAMIAVELDHERARALIEPLAARVSIAACNAPGATVLSGYTDAIDTLERELAASGTSVRRVQTTGVAGHGPQLESARHELAQRLLSIRPKGGAVALYSTLTGARCTGSALDPQYWGDQLRKPVQFSAAVRGVLDAGIDVFIELSPHPVLRENIRRCAADATPLVLPTLRRREDERRVLLGSAGQLFARGVRLKLSALYDVTTPPVPLPSYPFQRERFWIDAEHGPTSDGAAFLLSDDERQRVDAAGWCHRFGWTVSASSEETHGQPSHWLLLAHDRALADSVRSELEALGHRCTVDTKVPASTEEARSWLVRLAPAHVVQLGHAPLPELLRLCQAALTQPLRVWAVTRGAQHLAHEANSDPLAAITWGFMRVFANEAAVHFGALIDLDPSESSELSATRLARELTSAGTREAQVMYRLGVRYGGRVQRAVLPRTLGWEGALRADRSYLVTGGLGALGLIIAAQLARRGARRIVLVGRSALPDRACWQSLPEASAERRVVNAMLEIERLGANVEHVALDVADEGAWRTLVAARAQRQLPEIAGVVHCAGLVEDGTIGCLSEQQCERVLRPKVAGTLALLQTFDAAPLDWLVSFSSAAASLGSPGQANYAAANAFLDAIASARPRGARRVLSIGWGPWAEGGLASDAQRGARLRTRGIRGFTPQEGALIFDRVFASDASELLAVDADWSEVMAAYPDLAESSPFASLRLSAPVDTDESNDVRALASAGGAEKRTLVARIARRLLSKVSGHAADKLAGSTPLTQLGTDSLTILELRNRLQSALGVAPELAWFVSGASVDDLTEQLLAAIDEPTAHESGAAPASWLIGRRKPTVRARVFAFPYAGASPWVFESLSRQLPADVELLTVQLPGRGTHAAPLANELAPVLPALLDALAEEQSVPHVFFGYSVGGLVAYEAARALRSRPHARNPDGLLIAASRAPQLYRKELLRDHTRLLDANDDEFVQALREFGGTPEAVLTNTTLMQRVVPIMRADFGLVASYAPRSEGALPCPLVVCSGERDLVVPPALLRDWESLAPEGFQHLSFAGEGHFFVETRERELARVLCDLLDRRALQALNEGEEHAAQ